MNEPIRRRDFLKAASTAAGALAASAVARDAFADEAAQAGAATSVKISATNYTPTRGYPIPPKRYADVVMTDAFWKPRVARNAQVTIPFELQKREEGGRLSGNVLEAAMLSLVTHPDPKVQAQVDARVKELASQTPRGNGGFEAAVTYFRTT